MNFDIANFDVADGACAPVATHGVIAKASFALVFGIAARNWSLFIDRDMQYSGRCQVGDDLAFGFQAVGTSKTSSAGALPDRAPVVRIYRAATRVLHAFPVPADRSSGGAKSVFRGDFRPGPVDRPDRYWAIIQYLTAGLIRSAVAVFEVVPGGHRNGPVMTMSHFAQPSGTSFIAHHEAGIVTRGLRPYLDRGD